MLNSKSRNYKSENNQFLKEIKTLVIDECFPANTLVRVKDNIEFPIKKIVEDDSITHVLSYDEITGQIQSKKITRKITRDAKNNLVRVSHEYGKFVCTEDHKIWTTRGYVKAKDLTAKDEIKWIPLKDSLSCEECGRSFPHKSALYSHYLFGHLCKGRNSKHIKDERLCDKCGKSISVYGFTSHRKYCGMPKVKKVATNICRICDKIFKNACSRSSHELHHNKNSSFYKKAVVTRNANPKYWDAMKLMGEKRRGDNNPTIKTPGKKGTDYIRRMIEVFLSNHTSKVIKVRKWGKKDIGKVYDLEVEGNHNYFAKGVLVSNCHLLTSSSRGHHLESGIMKFTELNPDARLVLLSATMPNVNEVAEWISKLNGKKTNIIKSSYRPCPLNIHYPKYYSTNNYGDNEEAKIDTAIDIFKKHPEDKFLFFVHSKDAGKKLYDELKSRNINCEYHTADLPKEKRNNIERKFREDNKLRAVVATSGLAWGLNLPARRVVILGIHRAMTLVETNDITQMVGRSGRPKYDPCGDAYVLLPHNNGLEHRKRLETPQPIVSQMNGNTLAFHLVSEIHHRNVKTFDDVKSWYERTLAHHQKRRLDDNEIEEVVGELLKCGAVKQDDGEYETTPVGMISSLFYYSPYDVADLSRNFKMLFSKNKEEDDHQVSLLLANVDSWRTGIVSASERQSLETYKNILARKKMGSMLNDGVIKIGCCYYNLLNDIPCAKLGGLMRTLQGDFGRVTEVLNALDSMAGKWGKKDFFNTLKLRIQYGVPAEMAELCQLTGIGKVKAKRLWEANLRSLTDLESSEKVIKALGCSKDTADKICIEAKEISGN